MTGLRMENDPEGNPVSESSTLLNRNISAFRCEGQAGFTNARSRSTILASGLRTLMSGLLARQQTALFTGGKLPFVLLGVLTLAAGSYLVFNTSYQSSTAPEEIRVVLLADAHLIGPQYVCCSESNDVDNDSIMKTAARLKTAQEQIEALSPTPAAVVFLGDVIHNGYVSHDFEWYLSNRNAYTVGSELFGAFSRPVHYLWGNHDYHTVCGNVTASHDRFSLSHRLFAHFLGPTALPYSAVAVGRYNLIFLNAMLGPSWDPEHSRCDTRAASLGANQLRWLAGQLASKRPAFVFMHHPLPAAMRGEAPELPHPDVVSLLLAHAGSIMAVFSGHYHRGLNWSDAYPFPHLTLPACRYDSDNWFMLQLPQRGPLRSWRLMDWSKNKGGARCSESWRYPPEGEPQPEQPQPEETGSCGWPRLEEMDRVELQPLKSANDVPGPSGAQFNPEQPCSLHYQRAFMQLCIQEGSSAACCSILGEHLRASSAAYAASCMCWPPFWDQAQQLFHETGRNVTEVLQSCSRDHRTALQWPGQIGGSCLERGSGRLPQLLASEG